MKTKTAKSSPPSFDGEGYQSALTHLNGEPVPTESALAKLRPLTPAQQALLPLPKPGAAKSLPISIHGGARPGSGRKPSGRQPVLLRLAPATLRHLRSTARKRGTTLSAVVEECLATEVV